MKITRREIVDALVHDDPIVRNIIVDVLGSQKDQDIEVTLKAIEAIEKFGWKDAFRYPHHFQSFTLDASSTEWLLQEIPNLGQTSHGSNTRSHMFQWLATATPIDLLQTHIKKIESLGQSDSENVISQRQTQLLGFSNMASLEKARLRIKLKEATVDDCLQALNHFIIQFSDPKRTSFSRKGLMKPTCGSKDWRN